MSKLRIVIIGGGFGGVFTAKGLLKRFRKGADIELINSSNYFVFQPLLPEVASGNINAQDAVSPLRQLLPGVRVRMATVTGIDREAKTVQLIQGSFRKPQSVSYDHLVIAVGEETNQAIAPGFAEHSLCMRSLADAYELRNKVIRRLEHADITEDPLLKKRLLTFVVAGGGFSGVETVGEISEMVARSLRFYPNIGANDVATVLVQSGDRLLPELPEKLGVYASKMLMERGVSVLFGVRVSSATTNAVFLSDGTRLESCLLVTTVGNGPRDITSQLDLPLQRNKIPVDDCLRVTGASDVWALGDAALIPAVVDGEKGYAPATAQYAVREAKCLARNIQAVSEGKTLTPFSFRPRGSMASIGHYQGVAEILGIRLTGLPAWFIWRFLYIGMLPGFSARLRVALNWMFDYVLPRSIVQIETHGRPAARKRRYSKGDIVFEQGQNVDGFYAVLSGCLESRVSSRGDGEDFVRILGPGDHWGEKLLHKNAKTHGRLIAAEDSEVLILGARDFNDLRDAFPAMNEYFDGISDKIYAPSLRNSDH